MPDATNKQTAQPTPEPVLRHADADRVGLLIQPHDTLFFRDGRPFGPADQGRSLPLPFPQTLAGMLRTCLMRALGLAPAEMHGLREPGSGKPDRQRALAHLACRGPWLVKTGGDGIEDLYLPAPAHLCRVGEDKDKDKDKDSIRPVLLKPLPKDQTLPGWTTDKFAPSLRPLLHTESDESVEPETRWLKVSGVKKVLRGEKPEPNDLVKPEELFTWEPRTGVTIAHESNTGEDGLIYSTRQLRLQKGIAFYAEIGFETHAFLDEATDEIGRGPTPDDIRQAFRDELRQLFDGQGALLPFGGEGRRALVHRLETPFDWASRLGIPTNEELAPEGGARCFTWLISPLINHAHQRGNGSRPPWLPMGVGALAAAACPKPQPVSGWDLAGEENDRKGRPRPTRYAVPAGAVYFWERGKNNTSEKPWPADDPLVQLAENAKDRANGWGIALKGRWSE